MRDDTDDSLADKLRQKSRKLTNPRQAILKVLRKEGRPLASREIHEALPGGACNLATVYRSLHLLEGMGMVKRFDFGDGQIRFRLLEDGDSGHHHHLVCTRCRAVQEVEECVIHELEKRVAQRSGFQRVTHRLEFFGLCPACQ